MKKYKLQTVFNIFYRYLTVKLSKPISHTNAFGMCIFHSINLLFYEKGQKFYLLQNLGFLGPFPGPPPPLHN